MFSRPESQIGDEKGSLSACGIKCAVHNFLRDECYFLLDVL